MGCVGNNVNNGENISDYNLLLGLLQVYDLFLNLNQVSNDTILKELQNQDIFYLEKIIKQNEEKTRQIKFCLNGTFAKMAKAKACNTFIIGSNPICPSILIFI